MSFIPEGEPLEMHFDGEARAMLESEAIILRSTPTDVAATALALWEWIAPELRNGGKLILEVDAEQDGPEQRASRLRKLIHLADKAINGSRKQITIRPRIFEGYQNSGEINE